MNRNHLSEEELADYDAETDNTAEFNLAERAEERHRAEGCGVCGGDLDRSGECGWCDAVAVRMENERQR